LLVVFFFFCVGWRWGGGVGGWGSGFGFLGVGLGGGDVFVSYIFDDVVYYVACFVSTSLRAEVVVLSRKCWTDCRHFPAASSISLLYASF